MPVTSFFSPVEKLRLKELWQYPELEPVTAMRFVLLAPNASIRFLTLRMNNPLPGPHISEILVFLETDIIFFLKKDLF